MESPEYQSKGTGRKESVGEGNCGKGWAGVRGSLKNAHKDHYTGHLAITTDTLEN